MKKTNLLFLFSFLFIIPHSNAFPIKRIEALSAALNEAGYQPVAIFDLDETLIDSFSRKCASYQWALHQNEASLIKQWPEQYQKALELFYHQPKEIRVNLKNQYNSKELFALKKIKNEAFIKTVDQLMLPFYLGSGFMHLDHAIPGAATLLTHLYSQNTLVYFVSSRFEKLQSEATLINLKRESLYRNNRQSRIILRKEGESSLEFKKRAFSEIAKNLKTKKQVVLLAENEPENLNAMMTTFPYAFPVFIKGAILNTATPLRIHPRLIEAESYK